MCFHSIRTVIAYHTGLGTDEATLTRIVVSRCDVDMADIKVAFAHKYHGSLADTIKVRSTGLTETAVLMVYAHRVTQASTTAQPCLR